MTKAFLVALMLAKASFCAVTFVEPGGDEDFNTPAILANQGFWGNKNGTVVLATDFVHGAHVKSIKFNMGSAAFLDTPADALADSGGRLSIWFYVNALPTSAKINIIHVATSAGASIVRLYITSAGVLQLWRGAGVVQIGSNGSTLSTGVWYRISIAYTITSSSVNEFRVFLNGTLDISASNVASLTTASSICRFGNPSGDTLIDIRTSDHYFETDSSLTDPGNIWVTAKRPNANGTTNGFTTQIGSGGSGYGSGHSPQVNERPASLTNGWSLTTVASAITEEYNIESSATGDIDISAATIVDYEGWVTVKALTGETGSIIVNGAASNISITTSASTFLKMAGSSTYPAGSGGDIGVISAAVATTISLYECGVMVAYIPSTAASAPRLTLLGVGP